MAAEDRVITTEQMSKAREVDFVERFTGDILRKLLEALGVTRKIPMVEGTTMYVYKTTGTLQSGTVAEGDVIPLSQYARTKTPIGDITLKKWRKAVTAEAIIKSGADEAIAQTDKKLISDVQKGIRTDFFNFLADCGTTAFGASTFQAVLAQSWGKLQVIFEDDAVETVHFVNPLTIADYLAAANITVQTAFGMNYVEDFLGLGTVIMYSNIPQGVVYSTAKENLIMYYVALNGDLAREFELTADQTGFIGVHHFQTSERAQKETLVMSGIQFLVEYADGVVVGQIDATPSLQSITVASTAGTAEGDSNIAVSGYSLGTGEKYVYKTAKDTAPAVTYGQKLTGWTNITPPHDITPAATHNKITVAAVDAQGRAQAAGSDDITVNT